MSCTLALAIPYLAIVCADTRINLGQANGGQFSDAGMLSIHYKDNIEIHLKDYDRKIRQYPGGWAAGSGSFAVVDRCLAHLAKSNARTPSTINIVLKHAFESVYEDMKDEFVDGKQIEPTIITYTYRTRDSFNLSGFSIDDRIKIQETRDYFSTPPDISNAVVVQAQHELRAIEKLEEEKDLYPAIRQIARAFHIVHMASATVSNILDMAMLIKTDKGDMIQARLLQTNDFLINASDSEIVNQLKPVP
jgi:hypothetical protein